MEPDFPQRIWRTLSAPSISSPGQTLRGAATRPPLVFRDSLSQRGHHSCFSSSSLSPISVKHTGKHLESNSLLSPSVLNRRVCLPTGNSGRSLPTSTSFAVPRCAASTAEAVSCPAGRRRTESPRLRAAAGDGGRNPESRRKARSCEHASEHKAARGCADRKTGYVILP